MRDKSNNLNTQIGFESNNSIVITTSPNNSNNQFDYIGYLHNKGLDYMFLNANKFYNPINKEINKTILKSTYADYYSFWPSP